MTNTARSHSSLSAAPAVDPVVAAERSSYPAEGILSHSGSKMNSKKRTSPGDTSDEVLPPSKHQRTAVWNAEDGNQLPSPQMVGRKRKRAPKKPVRPLKPAPTNPATWPESQLDHEDQVTATEAKQQYRVTTWDLKYLPCEIMGGYMKYKPMQLYWERDIKRVAWEKHGGPEGWKWYLDKLRASHQKRFLKGSLFALSCMLNLKATGPPVMTPNMAVTLIAVVMLHDTMTSRIFLMNWVTEAVMK